MNEETKDSNVCGLIMPIASMEGTPYSKEFWNSVRQFLQEAVGDAGFELTPAWEDEKYGVIHARIIENIKTMRVMIGVIIGHNPNVMLECGMRIWTDLPILLIGEEGATIPFDIKPLECLGYPQDREYSKMCKLKHDISTKLKAMVSPDYHTFKSHFNVEAVDDTDFKVTKIELSQFMIDTTNELSSLKSQIEKVRLDFENARRMFELSQARMSAMSLSGMSNEFANFRTTAVPPVVSDMPSASAVVDDKVTKEE